MLRDSFLPTVLVGWPSRTMQSRAKADACRLHFRMPVLFRASIACTSTYRCDIRVEAGGMLVTAKSDLPQRTLDLLILKIVALGPVHGYAIAQRLQQVSRDVVQVPQGSLYPALHRLENRGLLAGAWTQTHTGRDAKFYRLTRKGKAQLETETAGWQRLAEAIGLVL